MIDRAMAPFTETSHCTSKSFTPEGRGRCEERQKSANSGRSFFKTKEPLQPFQATFDISCPRLSRLQMTEESKWVLIAVWQGKRKASWTTIKNLCGTLVFGSSYPASFFSIVRTVGWCSLGAACGLFIIIFILYYLASATGHCRYSCPVQCCPLNIACAHAPKLRICVHECMHRSPLTHSRPQSASLTRSWNWIRVSRMAFFFFGVWIRRIGPIFAFPNLLLTSEIRLRCLPGADTDRWSDCPIPPGTMSSILFAKHVSFEHSIGSYHPIIPSRKEEDIKNQTKVFQHPIDNLSFSDIFSSANRKTRVNFRYRLTTTGPDDIPKRFSSLYSITNVPIWARTLIGTIGVSTSTSIHCGHAFVRFSSTLIQVWKASNEHEDWWFRH